jgi:transposase
MGKRKKRQESLWVAAVELPTSPDHPFYQELNAVLDAAGFDAFAERECRGFYAPVMGRPSLALGRYFRLMLLGYFEGLDSERGMAWRASDSLAIRKFLLRRTQALPVPNACVRDTSTCGIAARRILG